MLPGLNSPLFQHPLLVFDGAMGTELYERGFYINRPFEELNTSHPQDVTAVHRAYIEAGAQVITTNTFSLPSPQLKKFDIADRQKELLLSAIENARKAIDQDDGLRKPSSVGPYLALSFGPMGELIEPLGRVSKAEVTQEYKRLAQHAESSAGFDLYILETFSNVDELNAAIDGIRQVDSNRPILASITTRSSETQFLKDFAKLVGERQDVQALGVNCSEGPSDLLSALKVLQPLTKKPIVIQPNAGIPRNINGRYFYMTSPDYLAKFAKRFIEAGAYGVGGCCGTGPDHIRAISQALRMMEARAIAEAVSETHHGFQFEGKIESTGKIVRPHSNIARSTPVLDLIKASQPVITVELTSPKGTDLNKFYSQLRELNRAGIRFVNVPDGARASTRVSSLHLAAHINSKAGTAEDFGVRVIPHLTTRDRNLIALQSDLLGASVNRVQDLLLITGDPPKLGSNKDTTAVFDIDSIGLAYLTQRLNEGLTVQGESIGQGTSFGIGVASNPTAINLELEIKRWKYKVESGADFAVTQPLYDAETFFRWKDQLGSYYRPHLVGIWPFISLRNAEFMAHEVPGVHVPAWAIEKMASVSTDPKASIRMGVEIAATTIRQLRGQCEGFAISAPLGKVDVVLEVLNAIS